MLNMQHRGIGVTVRERSDVAFLHNVKGKGGVANSFSVIGDHLSAPDCERLASYLKQAAAEIRANGGK